MVQTIEELRGSQVLASRRRFAVGSGDFIIPSQKHTLIVKIRYEETVSTRSVTIRTNVDSELGWLESLHQRSIAIDQCVDKQDFFGELNKRKAKACSV